MPPGTHLCSFKQACQDDLGGTLESDRWTFQSRENSGGIVKVFLLAKTSLGCWEVH